MRQAIVYGGATVPSAFDLFLSSGQLLKNGQSCIDYEDICHS